MTAPITYAKAGGPPDDWQGLRVLDLETGDEVDRVEEVNAAEGWLIRAKLNAEGMVYSDPDRPDEIARERLTGRFALIRHPRHL